MEFKWHVRAVLYVGGCRISFDDLKARVFGKQTGASAAAVEDIAVDGKSNLVDAVTDIFAAVRDRKAFCVVSARTANPHGLQAGCFPSAKGPAGGWQNEPRFQCLSSGSTGLPRRIARTHKSWIKSFERNAELLSITFDDSYAVLGDLVHSLSLYAVLEALFLGCDLHLLTGVMPGRQLNALSNSRITVIYATPAQIRLLGQVHGRIRDARLESVRLVLIGGSKLDRGTAELCRQMFPNAGIREFYGSSETSFVTMSLPGSPPGSVGLPYPEVEISIREEGGKLGAPGQLGEIWVRSPFVFLGYTSGDPGRTQWNDGFLTVGERGWLDGNGFLFIAGRRDRMVTVADQNVYPEEIENFLLGLPGVEQAAVVSFPDPMRGNRLVAVINAKAQGPTSDGVISECRSALGTLKTPKHVRFLDDWPMLRSGKTDFGKLKRLVSEKPE